MLAAATCLPLVVRRRYPLGVLITVTAGLLACLAVFHPDHGAVAVVMLAVYTVGLQGRRLRSLLVGAAMAPVVTAAVAITSSTGPEAGTTVSRLALVLAALAAGDARRGRRALIHAASERAEREREVVARNRFHEERMRLARELHDTVAHTLVAINVRAAAATHLQQSEPQEGFAALEDGPVRWRGLRSLPLAERCDRAGYRDVSRSGPHRLFQHGSGSLTWWQG